MFFASRDYVGYSTLFMRLREDIFYIQVVKLQNTLLESEVISSYKIHKT